MGGPLQLLNRNTSDVRIIFYGGEPLANFNAINKVVTTATQTKLNCNYVLITNGCLITEEIADFLKDNKFSVSISLDGNEKTNDKVRKTRDGNGSFEKVLKGLDILADKDIRFAVSCTISTHNIDCPEEILDILDQYKVRGMGFNLMTPNENIHIDDKDREKMIDNILLAEDQIIQRGIIEDRIINRKLKPFVEGKNWLMDCAGYGKQVVISPEGRVGTCHGLWPDFINENANTYFDIDVNYTGQIINHPTWIEWYNRTPLNMPQCWSCFGIGL